MASETQPGKTLPKAIDPKRFVGGPRAIGALLPTVTKAAFRARSPATAQILSDWREIVGPALAAVTEPRRLSGTTLTLRCAGPIALELQHLTGHLAQRINGHFGRTLVEQFRFVQGSVAGLAPPRAPRPPPPPVEIPNYPPGELRDALARLGASVAAARPKRGSRDGA